MPLLSHARSVAGYLAACVGAFVFHLIGFPVPALTGAALAVSVAGLLGARLPMPTAVRDVIFCLLGINIGAGVTPDMLRSAVQWPLSIAILAGALVLSMTLAQISLHRLFGYDRRTATLAAAPGHLSYVLSIAASDTRLDVPMVAVSQSIRVLFLTLCVPGLVTVVFGATGQVVLPDDVMTPFGIVGVLAATLALGVVFGWMRLPAAFLLAGMATSMLGHGSELTPGRLPDWMVAVSLIGMGALIGSRFSGVTWAQLRRAFGAGLWVTLINIVVTVAVVALIAFSLDVPLALGIVAFAPGGVEAMAAIAIALGLDPAFVAAHHVARLLLLTVLVPVLTARDRESRS